MVRAQVADLLHVELVMALYRDVVNWAAENRDVRICVRHLVQQANEQVRTDNGYYTQYQGKD